MDLNNIRIFSPDLFLLERWQEDSLLSPDAQREKIFSEFVSLGVKGRQPYKNQLRQRRIRRASDLTPQERELLDRVRQPTAERLPLDMVWLRTCYQPSSEAAFSTVATHLQDKLRKATILNDASLYDFGADWEKIFLRMPQLLETSESAEVFEESVQEALEAGIEFEAGDREQAEQDGYDPDEDGLPWPVFYSAYHMALIMKRIHIIDAKTLASEGRNAGNVLVVWYDECGRAVRSFRESLDNASDIAGLADCMLNEHGCWVHAKIGKQYQWGAPLGPPYGEDGGDPEDDEDDED